MTVQATIEHKLTAGLSVEHMEVVNESSNHNVPEGSESHFKVVLVSEDFEGKSLVARHQMIYRLLSEEMRERIHALALHTYTNADWSKRAADLTQSPACLGGGKSLQT
jgi:BolA protein